MMHKNREWNIADVASLEELAHKLFESSTFTCCTGFRVGELLFLNDATSEDGAQEYAIVRLTPNARPALSPEHQRLLDAAGALGKLTFVTVGDVPASLNLLAPFVGVQIESLTVSWVESEEKLLAYFEKWASGKHDAMAAPVTVRRHTGTCHLCQ